MAIYFVRNMETGLVKIGSARDPMKRLGILQVSSADILRIVRLLDGGMKGERELHARFAEHHKRGEWFKLTDEQITGPMPFPDLPVPNQRTGLRVIAGQGMSAAERQANQRERNKTRDAFREDLLAFIAGLEPWEASSMSAERRQKLSELRQKLSETGWENKKRFRELRTKARMAAVDDF